jgi:hypothetical protein
MPKKKASLAPLTALPPQSRAPIRRWRAIAPFVTARYCDPGLAQYPLRHVYPCACPQQSAVVVHFSYSFEHPGGCVVHTSVPASSGRQKPLQH